MGGKLSVAEMNAMGWMHIYPQGQWHMPAEIRGTAEALIALRDALARAIDGDGIAEAVVMASDGEGYGINIRRVNVLNLLGPLPYVGLFEDDRRTWADERHDAWRKPPEPFNPNEHQVILYVADDGSVSETPPPARFQIRPARRDRERTAMSEVMERLRAVLVPDDVALLRVTDERNGLSLGQRCKEAGLNSDRRGIAQAYKRMLYMEGEGLVCRMDLLKPIIWLRTPKGSAELVARDAEAAALAEHEAKP